MIKKYQNYIWYILTYIIIAAIYLWPILTNISTKIYAQPGDAFATLYDFWQLPYFNFNYYFPNQPIFLAVVKMFRFLFTETVVYNLLTFCSFIFTPIAGFLLIKKIIKNEFIAFFGGLILAVAPFRIAQAMQHANFADLAMMLFFIYFLLEIRENKKWVNVLGVFFFFSVTTLINYQYGFFSMIIYLVYLITNVICWSNIYKYNFLYSLIAILAGFVTIFAINSNLIYDFISISQGGQTQFVSIRSFSELNVYSAKWLYYFLPSPDNPFWGNLTSNSYNQIVETLKTNRTEQTIYLGIVNLILAIIALVNAKKINKFILWFSLLLIIFGIYFSFAPVISFGSFNLATPSALIYKFLPFFRVYARIGIITYFGVAILACYGLYYICEKIKNTYALTIFKIIIVVIVVMDLMVLPANRISNVGNDAMPSVYKQLLTMPKGQIVEYPQLPPEEPLSYQYLLWRRVHQLPIFYNYKNTKEEDTFRKSILNPTKDETINKLKEKNISYIVIHKNKYLNEKSQKYPEEYNFGIVPIPDTNNQKLIFIGDFNGDLLYQIK